MFQETLHDLLSYSKGILEYVIACQFEQLLLQYIRDAGTLSSYIGIQLRPSRTDCLESPFTALARSPMSRCLEKQLRADRQQQRS